MSNTITTLGEVLNIKWESQHERDIMNAIINHGTRVYDNSQGYPGIEYMNISKLSHILRNKEIQPEMGFDLKDLNDFLIKYNIQTRCSPDFGKPIEPKQERTGPQNTETYIKWESDTPKKTERTGKQIFEELEALQKLIEAHKFNFSNLTIDKAITINNRIRQILHEEL